MILSLLLAWALLPAFPRLSEAEPFPRSSQPASPDNVDLCSFLKDVEAKTDADCREDILAALKAQEPAAYVLKVELARKRKPKVLEAYEFLRAQPAIETAGRKPAGSGEPRTPPGSGNPDKAALPRLDPPINERTFPAWVGPGAKDLKEIYTHWLEAQNQKLQQERENSVSPERRKEIDATIAVNQGRIAALGKIKDSGELSCFLGESCGTKSDLTDTSVRGITTGKAAWTTAEYDRANAETIRQTRVPGGKLDRGVPRLGIVVSEVVENTPLAPLKRNAGNDQQSPLGTAATAALAATGALLLFGGLGGKLVEEKIPNIRRNMGIAALIGGVCATGAISWTRLGVAVPVATSPTVQDEARDALTRGQAALQRVGQSAPNLTTQAGESLQRLASGIATRAAPLLNAQSAQIDIRKFTEYALNPSNADGMHKARVFNSVLGYTRDNYQTLLNQIRSGILSNPAIQGRINQFGTRFTVDIMVHGPKGQALVRTGWIYDPGSQIPRLTTAFVK